ncbi:MAG: STAS domain-containing protein [Streptosporangiaceae bacterium]
MTPLDAQVSELGRYTLVTLFGEIDASNSDWFRDELKAAVTGADHAVIVDLQSLAFSDSAGLGVFVVAARLARQQQIQFEVAGPRGRVATVFRLLGMDKALHVRADVPECVQALSLLGEGQF